MSSVEPEPEPCPVCSGGRKVQFSAIVLNKHRVHYLYCAACGLLQTEQPYWLDEAYGSAIADADTGLLRRNISQSRTLAALLYFAFDRQGKYLDVAGGYGALTRLMRDLGFDFYWTDRYCENLLARGFEAVKTQPPFAAVTAFEVLEHTHEPLQFLQESLESAATRTVILSTELFDGEPPAPDQWWYYAFATGQHISFFQRRTLQEIANRLGLRCYSHGTWHVLTDKVLREPVFAMLTSRLSWPLSWYVQARMESKTMADHAQML